MTVKYKTRRGTDRGDIQKLRQEFFGKSFPEESESLLRLENLRPKQSSIDCLVKVYNMGGISTRSIRQFHISMLWLKNLQKPCKESTFGVKLKEKKLKKTFESSGKFEI